MIELGETFSSGTYKVTDSSGAAGAATVSVSVVTPTGVVASPTVNNPVLGSYSFDYLTTEIGPHPFIVTATGGVLGTVVRKTSDVFVVSPAAAAGIVSMAEVKAHLNIPLTDISTDTELELFIAAATEKIEHRCGPVVSRTITNERHFGGGRAVYLSDPPGKGGNPFITIVSAISVRDSLALTLSDLDVDPSGRVGLKLGYRFSRCDYLWTYTAGRTQIPAGLRQAALNFVKGSMETQRGPSGLPWMGAADTPIETPGMGLVMWRLEQDMAPFLRPPAVA